VPIRWPPASELLVDDDVARAVEGRRWTNTCGRRADRRCGRPSPSSRPRTSCSSRSPGVLRDPTQSEEVTQEVLVELWRTATRYSPARGGALSWVLTLAHRRAVDRVRAAQSAVDREDRAGSRSTGRPFDEVSESVTARMEREQVRRCLLSLTELQRESVVLAYYQGYTYREVAELLDTPLGTVKTRLRDGLIRLRDCLGVMR